ncbi:MAG: cadmium-translocating P-type ATPase [Oscillospiraceae bacterium]|nr:cadmium-translocating P-type ATPase [Oscillospiraceae bacterium]MBQ6493017.1 cadmium-translocating P-type ATPase [Erysipelotrichaceae bacterium]
MSRKQKKNLIRIIIAAVLLIALHFVLIENEYLKALLYLIPYLIVGYDILRKALLSIKNREHFDENFLMAIATIGAITLGEYQEGVEVMLFYQIGEWFQSYAVGRSRKNIAQLMDIRPDYANIEKDGELEQVDPDEVEVGDIIVVKVGEKIPIDGVVVEGETSLNTSALTGESRPRDVAMGDEVISGCINMTSLIKIKTTKPFGESTVSKVLDLIENATSNKSRSEDFITKFARYYTPAVCYSALALAIVPPLFIRFVLNGELDFSTWVFRALTFLVISCPCALVISIPLSFFAGIGGASKAGVLIKGSNYLEALSKTRYVAFDKTGTVTLGIFEVTTVHNNEFSKEELLEYAAHAEAYSNHPIARSIVREYGKELDKEKIESVKEVAGKGVESLIGNRKVLVGNDKLMTDNGIRIIECPDEGTIVHVAVDGEYKGHIHIGDKIKPTAEKAIQELKKAGVRKTIMLTGDDDKTAESVANKLGIDEVYAELLPQDKVTELEKQLKQKDSSETLAFVGDGINDAPVLSLADVGIAMGSLGSDAAIEAADIVLMDDDPLKIAKAIKIANKCMRIVYENIIFAITVKIITLILSAFGIAEMWLAIFADVGVMIIAVINAIRALGVNDI